jgi:integrase
VLRVFLRYAHRAGLLRATSRRGSSGPRSIGFSTIPRSIAWDDVGKALGAVDRRTACGKRDYAIVPLLVTYGLRGREVAALTLDDINWKPERLAIPERKAGHSTAFPLSTSVGGALLNYLQHGRPQTTDRHVCFRAMAPVRPIGAAAVSACATRYPLKAGWRSPSRLAHTAPRRHPAARRRRLFPEDDRGLRGARLGGVDGDLR